MMCAISSAVAYRPERVNFPEIVMYTSGGDGAHGVRKRRVKV